MTAQDFPALHKKSWAVIDRPYSLGCATVGALYERPRCIFCAKPDFPAHRTASAPPEHKRRHEVRTDQFHPAHVRSNDKRFSKAPYALELKVTMPRFSIETGRVSSTRCRTTRLSH